MYCNNCQQTTFNPNRFCTHCGAPFQPVNQGTISPAEFRARAAAQQQQSGQQDMGFVWIAILDIALTAYWLILPRVYENWYDNKLLLVFGNVVGLASWVIMLLYTKRTTNKIIIAVMFGLTLIYAIYNVWTTLSSHTGSSDFGDF